MFIPIKSYEKPIYHKQVQDQDLESGFLVRVLFLLTSRNLHLVRVTAAGGGGVLQEEQKVNYTPTSSCSEVVSVNSLLISYLKYCKWCGNIKQYIVSINNPLLLIFIWIIHHISGSSKQNFYSDCISFPFWLGRHWTCNNHCWPLGGSNNLGFFFYMINRQSNIYIYFGHFWPSDECQSNIYPLLARFLVMTAQDSTVYTKLSNFASVLYAARQDPYLQKSVTIGNSL